MKLNKKTLRRLIKEELRSAVEAKRLEEAAGGIGYQARYAGSGDRGPDGPEGVIPQDQLMALLDAGFDMAGVNTTNWTEQHKDALRRAGFVIEESTRSRDLERSRELEDEGMGHMQAKRVPHAEDADADIAELMQWLSTNVPAHLAGAIDALRGGGSAGTWHDSMNTGSPESVAGIHPEGVRSLLSLLDEGVGLARAQEIEGKLIELGIDEKTALEVSNDLINAAFGYTKVANRSGLITQEMAAEVAASGDVSDTMIQQIADGGTGAAGDDSGDWESAWSNYAGSSAGTQPALHAGEDK